MKWTRVYFTNELDPAGIAFFGPGLMFGASTLPTFIVDTPWVVLPAPFASSSSIVAAMVEIVVLREYIFYMWLPKNSGFMWLALVTYVASVADGYLTTKFSAELNPLLSPVFLRGPYAILLAKAALVPLFLFLGDMASKHRVARYGLLVVFGWCMAVVVIELAQLTASA